MGHGHDHSHGHGAGSSFGFTRVGRVQDRCEVVTDGRVAFPHGDATKGHKPDGEGHDHAHDHGAHGHGHSHRDTDRRKLFLTVGITAAILVAEVVGGFLSGSLALLSDAGHVLTDLSAQVLSLLALVFAARPADKRRTYGYYRLEILAALANGAALLILAGFILFSAVKRFSDPPEVHTGLMLVVAVIGLVANLLAAWMLHGAHTLNVRGAYLHIVSDAMASAAVVVGGAIMAWQGGLWIIDPILGVLIALIVVWGALRLIREATDVLLEAVPQGIDVEKVRNDVRALDGIEDVHDLHIWTITSHLYALSAHIVVKTGTLVADNDVLLKRIKQVLLRNHKITHSTLQIESTDYEHVGHVH